MTKWYHRGVAALLIVITAAAPMLAAPGIARAQFFTDDPESDFGTSPEDEFFEMGADEFGEPLPGSPEQDITEGDTYVDEGTQPATITVGGRQVQLRLATERELLPMNAAWGAGTGLLIGGWFALINAGSNRETQRAIGVGIVLGAIIGTVVGLKYVINPSAPSGLGDNHPPASPPERLNWQPLVSVDDTTAKLGVRLTF
jgi:hypothetical protein